MSFEYKDFITFEHNKNHFFGWVNEGKVILRSEAYPSAEKMKRGIKAIIKNREINERYSIDSQHGIHFLVLWGGGNHQKHTGNMQSHNEIGRSCPIKSKDELYTMMGFMGKNFVSKTFQVGGVSKSSSIAAATTAAATGAAAIAATSKSKTVKTTTTTATKGAAARASATSSSGGGFKWWYLLPLLLIPIFFMWKGCAGDTDVKKAVAKTEMPAAKVEANAAALAAEKEAKMKADAEAKIKAEADAAKLAAEQKAAKANKGGSGRNSNRSSNSNVNFGGNKSSGY